MRMPLAKFLIGLWWIVGSGLAVGAAVQDSLFLEGTVVGSRGEALGQSPVRLQSLDSGAVLEARTDDRGFFRFDHLPPGRYRVQASRAGFREQSQEVVVGPGNRSDARLVLAPLRSESSQSQEAPEIKNPNIFVNQIDHNVIRERMDREGPNPTFIGEFRASENNYGREYGYRIKALDILEVGKTQRQHRGTVFETHLNSVLNARPFFNVGPLRPWKRNQYGAAFAGPFFSNQWNYTFNFEETRSSGYVNGNLQAPLAREREPRATDPVVRQAVARLLSVYPPELPNLPHISLRQLNTNAVQRFRDTLSSLHLDYVSREKDAFAFQYSFGDYSEDPFEFVAGGNPVTRLRPQGFSASHLHTFSPDTQVRAGFNFSRLKALLEPSPNNLGPDVGVGGQISNIGPGSQFPRRRFENHFRPRVDFSARRGRHHWSAGFALDRIRLNDLQSDESRGAFNFTNNFGRTAVENFLLGTPTAFTITLGNLYRGFRNWEFHSYAQDRISVTSSFSLTLGVRHEVVTAPTEVNDLTEIPYETDANNFSAVAGLAWSPSFLGGDKTVVRAGYGTYFGSIFLGTYQQVRFNPPAIRIITVQNPSLIAPLEGLDLSRFERIRTELSAISPDLVTPYSHQYTLGIEREWPGAIFLRVGYLGSRTFKLFYPYVTNRARPVPGIPLTTATINDRRPDPRFLRISTIINNGISYFDALQVAVNKRFGRGLGFRAEYNFSKAMDSTGVTFSNTTNREPDAPPLSQTENDLFGDLKGFGHFDTPHILNLSFSSQLPLLDAAPAWAKWLFGRWSFSGVVSFRSGQPFDIDTGSDSPGFGNVDGERQDRPNLLNTAVLGQSFDHPDTAPQKLQPSFFDPNITARGRGNLGRKVFRMDGVNNFNLAFTKTFPYSQELGKSVQFQAVFLNALNHPRFAPPGDVLTSETFGKIINTRNRGRIIELTLRLNF